MVEYWRNDNGRTTQSWWSCVETRPSGGVGFIVHKDYVKSVLECELVSSSFFRIRLNATPRNLTIIQIYAPTTESSDDEFDPFYSLLQTSVQKSQRRILLSFKVTGFQRLELILITTGQEQLVNLGWEPQMKEDFDCWNLHEHITW